MVDICRNRPEGFGPHSTLSSPLPTTCFTDTVLIPLPIYLSLLAVPILFLLNRHHNQRTNYNSSTTNTSRQQKSWLFTTTSTIYYILIACNILMQTLEIVRFKLLHYGIALLPLTYVGLLLGGMLHQSYGFHARVRYWEWINATIWLGGAVVNIVKVAGLAKMGIEGRRGSKYPLSDQVIDVAVIAGVYVVIAGLEVLLGRWRRARRERERVALKESARGVGSPTMEEGRPEGV